MRVIASISYLIVLGLVLYAVWIVGSVTAEVFVPQWFWQAEISGMITDERGEPAAGAQVCAEYFGDRSVTPIPGSRVPALCDEQGRFALKLVPGPVTLFARKEGIGTSHPIDLELDDEQEIPGIELRLDPGGRVTGVCVDRYGNPQPGRWIAIEHAGYRHWRDEDRIANVLTGNRGEFGCEGVPAGGIRVMLDEAGSRGPWYPFDQEQVVTVKRAQTTHVRFEVP